MTMIGGGIYRPGGARGIWTTILILLAFGAAFAGFGTWMVEGQLHALNTYLPVKATVFHHRIRTDDSGNSNTTYEPRVWYRYTVGGRQYTSHRAIIGGESAGYSWAQAIVNRFPVGKTCTAYYDPNDPTQAFLVHKMDKLIWIFPCLGYVILLAGVIVLVVKTRRIIRARN